MSRPLTLSVVIPTYRAAAFLPDAIASVRAQTRAPAEVIVVDDASPDDTADVAASLGARVVRQEANRGPSAARNRGVALAAGDLVAFLDADDAWLPWHLELCAGALEAHPRAAIACTEAAEWDVPPPPRPAAPRVVVSADATVDLLCDPFIPQAAAVVRRPAVAEAGWYDERFRYAEDFDLWMRIAARHTVARVRCAGVRRRPHPAQVSNATLQMVEHGSVFRLRAFREIAQGADPARTARAAAALGEALDRDLHSTWYRRDAAAFEHLLAVAAEVPGTDAMRRRWQRKRRYGWALWHALRSAKYAVSGEPL